ncbi:fumarylacetoacetate hydrolase family protein [Mycobacteroides abscessus]|uniref:fumarylacetoacetate hydrolase family protein n=1 Tax=Mycobacteroides abscessus TaxID=36809 RepID=UPI000C25D770|nr:fumarylacetoacetate hydrolase family protein [Mycobacteroides abscessus]
MRLYTTDRGIARQGADGHFSLLDLPFDDIGALLRYSDTDTAARALASRVVASDHVSLAPVILRPGKILAVGLNYLSHAEEALEKFASIGRRDVQLPAEPNIQIVAGSAVQADGRPMMLPVATPHHVDYEGELAVVIGRAGFAIRTDQAWGHVAGLSIINDVSARDIQQRAYTGDPAASIGIAKSFDTFKPLGPCLVTADEFTEKVDLRLQTRVNGDLRQDDRTGNLIHSIPELIAYISRYHTLEPGDVIATGSPRGAGQFTDRYLRPGDVVEISIEHLGTLTNSVQARQSTGTGQSPLR